MARNHFTEQFVYGHFSCNSQSILQVAVTIQQRATHLERLDNTFAFIFGLIS